MIIVNPGTEAQSNHSADNATKTAEAILQDLEIKDVRFARCAHRDSADGWYGFDFIGPAGKVDVDIPGIAPDVVTLGRPFKSPRLYVDGSSWLYGYALSAIERKIGEGDE